MVAAASRPNLGVSLLPPRFNEIIHEIGWLVELVKKMMRRRKGWALLIIRRESGPHWSPSVAERWSFNHSRPMIVAISARCRPLGSSLSSLVSARPEEEEEEEPPPFTFWVCATIFAVTLWPAGRISTRLLTFSISIFPLRTSSRIVSSTGKTIFHSCDFIRQDNYWVRYSGGGIALERWQPKLFLQW